MNNLEIMKVIICPLIKCLSVLLFICLARMNTLKNIERAGILDCSYSDIEQQAAAAELERRNGIPLNI
jgi:hypothetical protein